MIIAIDFDGVISGLKALPGKRMGEPLPGAQEALDKLNEWGFTVIVYTVKAATEAGREAVEDWLEYYDFQYVEVTAIKPNAIIYIDDRAVRFDNWSQTLSEVTKLTGMRDDE